MARTGYGITITFASGFAAEIISTTPNDMTREPIETTHTASPNGAKTFMPSDLIDYGELTFDINYNEGLQPPINSPPEPVVINYSSGATHSFDGFMISITPEAPIDDRMTATVTIKATGEVVYAGGA